MTRGTVALAFAALFGCDAEGRGLATENRRLMHELDLCRTELELAKATNEPTGETTPSAAAAPTPPPPPAEEAPVDVLRSRVRINSATTSELSITLRNKTRRTIDGFRFHVEVYDAFNNRVRCRWANPSMCGGSPEVFLGRFEDGRIAPRETRTLASWSMFDYPGSKAIVIVSDVHFTDNTTWSGEARQLEDPRAPEGGAATPAPAGQSAPATPRPPPRPSPTIGIPACDAYARRACNCTLDAVREQHCAQARSSIGNWRQRLDADPAARVDIEQACESMGRGLVAVCGR